MAKTTERQGFVLYHDIRKPLELLDDAQRGKLFLAILDYSEHGLLPDFDDAVIDMAFAFIQNFIDRDADAYKDKCEKRAIAGSKGGKQRVANQANQANATFASNFQANSSKSKQTQANPSKVKQSQANQADNETVTVNANVNANVSVTDSDNVGSAQDALPVEKSVEKSVSRESVHFSVFDGQKTSGSVIANMPTFETVEKYCAENHPNVNAQEFYDYYKDQGWRCNGQPIKSWKSLLSSWAKHQREKPQEQSASYDVDEFVRLAMSKSFEDT